MEATAQGLKTAREKNGIINAASLKISKLSCAVKRGGIKNNVIVNVGFIYVSSNDKCVFSFGEAHTQLITDFVGKLGCNFPGLKGLSYLIGDNITCLLSACYIIILPLR